MLREELVAALSAILDEAPSRSPWIDALLGTVI